MVNITSTLNNILEYLNDSCLGYEQCADAVNQKVIASFFSNLATKRKLMAAELAEKIKNFNANPEERGTVSGAAHRFLVNLKGLVTAGNVDSIVNEVKRGENTAINSYKEALRENLPQDVRDLLVNQLNEFEKDLGDVDRLSAEA
jgi:uncharacterized protein (TIGR02284 family)